MLKVRCSPMLYIKNTTHIPQTKQTVQIGRGDNLRGNLNESGGSTAVKTGDSYSAGDNTEEQDLYKSNNPSTRIAPMVEVGYTLRCPQSPADLLRNLNNY